MCKHISEMQYVPYYPQFIPYCCSNMSKEVSIVYESQYCAEIFNPFLSLQGSETCLAIFLPALVMGNFMVLNLFLALLLNSFNSEELKSRQDDLEDESRILQLFVRIRVRIFMHVMESWWVLWLLCSGKLPWNLWNVKLIMFWLVNIFASNILTKS